MEKKIPNSLREKYIDDRQLLYKTLWSIEEAISELVSGNVSSYSIGNRSCTYSDIDKLRALRDEAEERINEIEALLRGASPRNVTVSTFLDPSICVPRF